MATFVRRLAVAALAGVALWALTAPAQAQQPNPASGTGPVGGGVGPRVMPNSSGLVNPNWQVWPGVPLNQAAYNTAVYGNAMNHVPPWVYGYNPYPQVQNNGPVYNPLLSTSPFSPAGYPAATMTSLSTPSASSYPGYPNSMYSNPFTNPYYPYYGYGYGGPTDLTTGYMLQGAAAAINAQGQFNIQNQQAKLVQQQVEQSKVDTRRKQFDEYLYEKANTPTVEDIRNQMLGYELRRVMRDPSLPDILSGGSLDTIYRDLLTKQPQWNKGPALTIDDGVLSHINLTSRSGGNPGLLKRVRENDTLPWPNALKGEAFAKEVKSINNRLPEAVKQAEGKGSVDPGLLANLRDSVRALDGMVAANVSDMAPSDNVAARRFLAQLDSALKALEQGDVADHLNGKFAAKGKTVPDLLKYMSERGLTFGPATPGDEAAYHAMQNYLAGFNAALGGGTPPQQPVSDR